jgi:hypothetical protein
VKLVHLVGFIIRKFVTMHGHMNVKFVLIALWSVSVKLIFQCIKRHFNQGMHNSRETIFICDKFFRGAPNILGDFLYGTCFKSTFGRLKFGGGFYIFLQNLYTPVLGLTFICSVV